MDPTSCSSHASGSRISTLKASLDPEDMVRCGAGMAWDAASVATPVIGGPPGRASRIRIPRAFLIEGPPASTG